MPQQPCAGEAARTAEPPPTFPGYQFSPDGFRLIGAAMAATGGECMFVTVSSISDVYVNLEFLCLTDHKKKTVTNIHSPNIVRLQL